MNLVLLILVSIVFLLDGNHFIFTKLVSYTINLQIYVNI